MAIKHDRVVTSFKALLQKNHKTLESLGLARSRENLNHCISITTVPMATKLVTVITRKSFLLCFVVSVAYLPA